MEEPYRYMYFNHMNLALKNTVRGKQVRLRAFFNFPGYILHIYVALFLCLKRLKTFSPAPVSLGSLGFNYSRQYDAFERNARRFHRKGRRR